MHRSVMNWVAVVSKGLCPRAVLELGSLDVNGSVRPLFTGEPFDPLYVGIDMRAGPRVDVRAEAAWLPFPDQAFDLVVSTEMLEHDLTFWHTIEEARRVLVPGGTFLVTARGLGFPLHGYPMDYYRFTPEALARVIWRYRFHVLGTYEDPQYPGVFVHAQKPEGET